MHCIETGQMYNVNQHWDPLKVCAVGRSYPPEFYDYISNKKVRQVFYRIAEETEEDYQSLISKLESFGVEIVRPEINNDFDSYFNGVNYVPPPMTPRDYTAMIGTTWYTTNCNSRANKWQYIAGNDWPQMPESEQKFNALPDWILKELDTVFDIKSFYDLTHYANFLNINEHVTKQGNSIVYSNINSANCTRIGKDLYFGTESESDNVDVLQKYYSEMFPDYRCHIIDTGGHSDAVFCPVKPGLIVSLYDIPTYEKTFPDWEVVYLPYQSWEKVDAFLGLKDKNKGKWWVPGQELNDDFTNFVEKWMNDWVGYVEETVFDVNMLVVDAKNVICNNYNQKVFDAFSRHGITPHVVNFRHRYFWDGGLHCITSDLHREGTIQDYFPQRN